MTPSTVDPPTVHEFKSMAGRDAAGSVESGMRVGLGTGSTVAHFLLHLGDRIAGGELSDVVGVPTSIRTETAALELGIPLRTLGELGALDLTVDGADEVDPGLNLIKGLGGAMLREKMVAQASRRMLAIVDDTKLVGRLGERAPVPVEVIPFEFASHLPWLERMGAEPVVRRSEDGSRYVTDNGNFVIDCHFAGGVPDPRAFDEALAGRAGLVESGLFLEMADEAVVAGQTGVYRMTGEDSR
ncbi:MAG: ribose-5-phosphate isomerase RpiA [Gemmatimonadetes bacterium]|nr:ribose-5-phosphate isomerase RpiA [Gemmatimonadota bacterium]MCY3678710.1 ribose-5-phosphate isomerase RpiA [Gemmatimonadota bacterium]